ncbi:MAG: efflux RND transporter periplasmic adaptor subunit [Phormidesmis sp.]
MFQRSSINFRLFPVFIVIALMLGAMAWGRRSAVRSRTPADPLLAVEANAVEPVSAYQRMRTYTGELRTKQSSELGFEQSALLTNMQVEAGDYVAAGETIAQLDTQILETEKQAMQAEKSQLEAQLQELETGARPEQIKAAEARVQDLEQQQALANTQRQRRQSLYDEGAVSLEQLDTAVTDYDTLSSRLAAARSELSELVAGTRREQLSAQKARIDQINARLQRLDLLVQKSTLVAPFSGWIAARYVDEGTVVEAGQPVFRLLDQSLEARVGVPKSVAGKLKIGERQSVEINGDIYQARLKAVLPEVDANTRTATLVFAVEASDQLLIGQMVRLSLEESVPTAGYWVPTTSLVEGNEGIWSVYVLQPQRLEEARAERAVYRVVRQDLEILHPESDRVFVKGTLQPGNQVILRGVQRVTPGQLVTQIAE